MFMEFGNNPLRAYDYYDTEDLANTKIKLIIFIGKHGDALFKEEG